MKIMKTFACITAPALLALAGCSNDVTRVESVSLALEPVTDSDLAANELVRDADLERAVNAETAPISMSWKLDASSKLELSGSPQVVESRQYWTQVSSAELAGGVDVAMSAPGAVIKLSPATAAAGVAPIALDDLVLVDVQGRVHQASDAVEIGVTSDELGSSEMQIAPGSTVFKVSDELGGGALRLGLADSAAAPAHDLLLHVYEPASPIALALRTQAPAYLQGQTLVVEVDWRAEGEVTPASQVIQGEVRSPSGTRSSIELVASRDGTFVGRLELASADVRPGELWEVELEASADSVAGEVRRTVKTAFAYAQATAGLDRDVAMLAQNAEEDLRMRFDVRVGSAGRYALTGVLHGTSPEGELQPLMIAQSAAYLEAGEHALELAFDGSILAASSLAAPYEVRDLRLLDQTRLGLLHRQARAVVIPSLVP